jgi:HEAT repeat protein
MLKENTGVTAVAAATALALIDPRNRDGLPALFRWLRDQNIEVRDSAAASLKYFAHRYLGNKEKAGVKALIEAMTAAKGNVAGAASCVSTNFLVEALEDEIEEFRCIAAEALGAQGAEAKSAVPALRTAIMDASPEVRKSAANALLKIRASK